ncbi:MAG: hypothetical protein CR968_03910 [Flavobacteriia bacterium]|nr:MAG: hypothetical protein CR968_03910 [Flavobacteriia bacterium]
MSKFFKALLWFILLAIIALIAHYYRGQHYCGKCNDEVKPKTVMGEWKEFSIADANGKSLFKFPQGFLINNTDGNVQIADAMGGFKDSIFNYLNAHQEKELLITGKYNRQEGEPIGLKRAGFLKDLLVKFGINRDRIIPKGRQVDFSFADNGKYNDGIGMAFRQIPAERMKIIEEGITNRTLYADFGNAEFKPDYTLQAYAFELKNYLSKHPDKTVMVTGHTDNVGKPKSNYNLGLKRAKNVVDYLVSQGIKAEAVKHSSKGQEEPIADNETEEGRAKNRRITVVVE